MNLHDAELAYFGEFHRQFSVRRTPGGEDRLDDLAQAWIDGDRERVLEYVRAHEAKVSERSNECRKPGNIRKPRKANPKVIFALRSQGFALQKIADALGLSLSAVHRIVRKDPNYVRIRARTTEVPSLGSVTT